MTSCHSEQHPMLKNSKSAHFDLLKEIGKESNQWLQKYQTFFIKAHELKGLAIISVRMVPARVKRNLCPNLTTLFHYVYTVVV
jgi:hypothetical protein